MHPSLLLLPEHYRTILDERYYPSGRLDQGIADLENFGHD